MGCVTCGSGKPAGCRSNGSCATGGCNKMNTFDWLSHLEIPADSHFNIVEVRFKNGRKDFFRNSEELPIDTGDAVVVEMPSGYHLGYVSLRGELVRLQLRKKHISVQAEMGRILRLATEADLESFRQAREREMSTLFRTREIIREMGLEMKLNDVEFQADQTKATFYYTADGRIDFRELIKVLAAEFKIRIEMRQISLRQEAARLGGIGVCGRELCCSTWLTDFKTVATSVARYQNLSLNPAKLSGQCGRLKCCLNYELDTYVEALQDIPQVEVLQTAKGKAYLRKTDIFKKILWFAYEEESTWHPLSVERVREIMEMNAAGQSPEHLLENIAETDEDAIISQQVSLDLGQLEANIRERERSRQRKSKRKKKPKQKPEANTTSQQKKKSKLKQHTSTLSSTASHQKHQPSPGSNKPKNK